MDTQAEQSTTGQNREESSSESSEPVAAQSDRDEELARLEDRWRRAVADLDNLRKRYARELDRERMSERARVASAWLQIVDNLERAISHAGGESSPILDGVRDIVCEAVQVLEHLGYPRDAEVGMPFDPQRHEVVGVVDHPDSAPGTVLEVVRPGYGEGSRQLRPASVVVSRREE
jgi:molecular chaperone GrpE